MALINMGVGMPTGETQFTQMFCGVDRREFPVEYSQIRVSVTKCQLKKNESPLMKFYLVCIIVSLKQTP